MPNKATLYAQGTGEGGVTTDRAKLYIEATINNYITKLAEMQTELDAFKARCGVFVDATPVHAPAPTVLYDGFATVLAPIDGSLPLRLETPRPLPYNQRVHIVITEES
jgi:hypothetical protein